MTLPAALQERLAKRGLVNNKKEDSGSSVPRSREEVFAESYDDPSENVEIEIEEIVNCPNTNNPYHQCTAYCKNKYGFKKFTPDPVIERRRLRMLKMYPLPPGWKEVPDIHTNRYYYWNSQTDGVCWLSPSHPKAEIVYKAQLKSKSYQESAVKKAKIDSSDLDEFLASTQTQIENKAKEKSSSKSKDSEPLDPMDPSSYSNVPRGKWSDGLDKDN